MDAQVDQVGSFGEPISHQAGSGLGQQHLTAVPYCRQVAATRHAMAEVATLITQLRLTGVHRHSRPQYETVGPGLSAQGSLGVQSGSDRVRCSRKHGDDSVAAARLGRSGAPVFANCFV